MLMHCSAVGFSVGFITGSSCDVLNRTMILINIDTLLASAFSLTTMAPSKTVAKSSELNPRSTSYEFLGPPGALFVTITVPSVAYGLYFACSEATECRPNLSIVPEVVLASLSNPAWWKGLWDTQAAQIYLAWYAFCVVAWAVLPGDRVEGTTLRTGGKKLYKINGMKCVSSLHRCH